MWQLYLTKIINLGKDSLHLDHCSEFVHNRFDFNINHGLQRKDYNWIRYNHGSNPSSACLECGEKSMEN